MAAGIQACTRQRVLRGTVTVVPVALPVIVACTGSPAIQDDGDVIVFTVTINFETGELDYDPNAFDGYGGGPLFSGVWMVTETCFMKSPETT